MEFFIQPLVQAISVIIIVLVVLVTCLKIRQLEFIGCAFKTFGRAWVDFWLK